MQVQEYALAAPPLVRWLIKSDVAVYDAVRTFVAGGAELDYVDVAGPPDTIEAARAKKYGQAIPLPTVRLNMRMARHHLTNELGVLVLCSDADLFELQRWQRLAVMPKVGRA